MKNFLIKFQIQFLAIVLASMVIVIDRVTEQVVLSYIRDNSEIIKIAPFFNLVWVGNEGISFESIEFVDNQSCLDLIEKNPGIISMLDEEVVTPRGSDMSVVEKMHNQFGRSKKDQHPNYDRRRQNAEIF